MSPERARPRYLVGPVYDWCFFLAPPLVSLVIGIAIANSSLAPLSIGSGNGGSSERERTVTELLLSALVHAHLVAVIVRSHGNEAVRRRHPIRFWVVPVALWALLASSVTLAVTALVVATFWDVYHSGAQTFGLARLYDRSAGNAPTSGRRLDFWLNQLLYAGPVLGGATLVDHLRHFREYDRAGLPWLTTIPAQVLAWQRPLAWTLVVGGTIFLVGYVAFYVAVARRGHHVSWLKVFLLTSTGACSVYTWGWNSWGQAFLIMNLFHAVQYLALVWHTERSAWATKGRRATLVWLPIYLAGVFAYGFLAESIDARRLGLWAVTLVVSLMHFWYDGFIWSVRRGDV